MIADLIFEGTAMPAQTTAASRRAKYPFTPNRLVATKGDALELVSLTVNGREQLAMGVPLAYFAPPSFPISLTLEGIESGDVVAVRLHNPTKEPVPYRLELGRG